MSWLHSCQIHVIDKQSSTEVAISDISVYTPLITHIAHLKCHYLRTRHHLLNTCPDCTVCAACAPLARHAPCNQYWGSEKFVFWSNLMRSGNSCLQNTLRCACIQEHTEVVLPCSNHSINNASKLTDNMGIDSTARPTCGLTQIYTE